MEKTFGCCRKVYNYYLEMRKTAWETEKKNISVFDCMKDLTNLKKTEEFSYLCEVHTASLQQSLQDLERTYSKFFHGIKNGQNIGYPRFRLKRNRQSYRAIGHGIHLFDKHVQLPKIGKVKCRVSKKVEGRILSITVIKNPSNKYYISVCCTDVPEKHLPKTGKSVGIDINSADNLMTFSDGTVIPNPKFLKQSQKKIARLQKELSRKTSGSENYKKTRIKLAKAHEHVANQRKDYINKLTTDIVRKYDDICIEDLKVSEMQKNHFGAKAALEVSFYEIRRQLEYKCAWYGKNLHIVDRYFPSSQLCSFCGWKNPKTKDLSVREWDCPCCGAHHMRDLNAALNILQEGLQMLA